MKHTKIVAIFFVLLISSFVLQCSMMGMQKTKKEIVAAHVVRTEEVEMGEKDFSEKEIKEMVNQGRKDVVKSILCFPCYVISWIFCDYCCCKKEKSKKKMKKILYQKVKCKPKKGKNYGEKRVSSNGRNKSRYRNRGGKP